MIIALALNSKAAIVPAITPYSPNTMPPMIDTTILIIISIIAWLCVSLKCPATCIVLADESLLFSNNAIAANIIGRVLSI